MALIAVVVEKSEGFLGDFFRPLRIERQEGEPSQPWAALRQCLSWSIRWVPISCFVVSFRWLILLLILFLDVNKSKKQIEYFIIAPSYQYQ